MDRLFVYGSLQPGGPNEHVLADFDGQWEAASIRGRLMEQGWGAEMGFPGLVLDQLGEEIRGYIISSAKLAECWDELDEFEGEEYQRVLTTVSTKNQGPVEAYVYVLKNYSH